MKTSAYIPAFNNRGSVVATIASIRAQSHPVDELFVMDDGSCDGTADVAAAEGVRVVRLNQNQGRGAARARAMVEAAHEYVLCCDAAKSLDPDFLKNALPWFDDPRLAAVFGCIVQPPPRNGVERWRGRHLFATVPGGISRAASLATGGALMRASAVRGVGNFDSRLKYGEDIELGKRLLAADFDVVCDPKLKVISGAPNSLPQVLERYWRWNSAPHGRMGLRAYLRQISYSMKVMARKDLAEGDVPAALISLLSPHYQLLKSCQKEASER